MKLLLIQKFFTARVLVFVGVNNTMMDTNMVYTILEPVVGKGPIPFVASIKVTPAACFILVQCDYDRIYAKLKVFDGWRV